MPLLSTDAVLSTARVRGERGARERRRETVCVAPQTVKLRLGAFPARLMFTRSPLSSELLLMSISKKGCAYIKLKLIDLYIDIFNEDYTHVQNNSFYHGRFQSQVDKNVYRRQMRLTLRDIY